MSDLVEYVQLMEANGGKLAGRSGSRQLAGVEEAVTFDFEDGSVRVELYAFCDWGQAQQAALSLRSAASDQPPVVGTNGGVLFVGDWEESDRRLRRKATALVSVFSGEE